MRDEVGPTHIITIIILAVATDMMLQETTPGHDITADTDITHIATADLTLSIDHTLPTADPVSATDHILPMDYNQPTDPDPSTKDEALTIDHQPNTDLPSTAYHTTRIPDQPNTDLVNQENLPVHHTQSATKET